MDLGLIRVIIDFGLMILIWLIQLIVYPSFKYFAKEELENWHEKYTFRIAVIVIPLMFIQLIIYSLQVIKTQGLFEISSLTLVLSVWIITFLSFVPRHNSITKQQYSKKTLEELVQINWSRTFLWTLIFIWSVKFYISI